MRKQKVLFCLMLTILLLVYNGLSAAAQPVASHPTEAHKTAYSIQNANSSIALALEGDGTQLSPFMITSKEQLDQVRSNLSASYRLQNDIVFDAADFQSGGAFYSGGQGFVPIGTQSQPFVGRFDGNGHAIHGLVGGLFGYLGTNGAISNLNMEARQIDGIAINTMQIAGGIVQYMLDGVVDNCSNTGSIQGHMPGATHAHVGGIVGRMEGGTISNCRNSGSVAAYAKSTYIGGIAGFCVKGTITDCVNSGDIMDTGYTEELTWDGTQVGGIVGYSGTATIANCSNSGGIVAEASNRLTSVGGIVGYAVSSLSLSVCSNAGDIRGSGSSSRGCNVGGIAGIFFSSSSVSCAYNTGTVMSTGVGSPARAGGITGNLVQNSNTISDSFNAGSIHASSNGTYESTAGGITASGFGGTTQIIKNSYNVGGISASDGSTVYVGAIVGDFGTTTDGLSNCYYLNRTPNGVQNGTDTALAASSEQLKNPSTFAGFDFSSVWMMEGNATYPYPELRQMPVQGKFVTSIEITNQEVALEQGQTLQMHAKTQPDDADDRSVQWTVVTETGGATLSQNGLLTATKPGMVTVIAAANDASGCYDAREMQILGNCAVSFDAQSGGTAASQTVQYNDLLTRPTDPTRTGADFVGWYKDTACTNPWNFATDRVTADMTLYAKWNINFYTVTFDSQSGSTVASKNIAPSGLIPQPLPSPTRTRATFSGWYKDASYTSPWNFATDLVTADVTLYARWTFSSSIVTFDSQRGSAVASQNIVPNGVISRPSDPTRTGYNFGGWYKEAACTNAWNFTTNTVTADMTLYAKWTPTVLYNVAFYSTQGNVIAVQSLPYDCPVTKPTDPINPGFIFGGWYKEAACVNLWSFETDTVTTHIQLYAKWTDEPSGQFTVSGGTDYSYSGATHTLTINKAGTFTLSMKGVAQTTRDSIVVNAPNGPVNLTLNNVNIDVSGYPNGVGRAFVIEGMSIVKLTLNGTNTLKSGYEMAGLYAPYGTVLTVSGSGSLNATGGGAGIGGDSIISQANEEVGGTITINSGTVTATGGSGAGIGGGCKGPAGSITINGGTVTATGDNGAGIGGGSQGSGGITTINGGTVTATGINGAGIGGGSQGSGGNLTINGGTVTAVGGGGSAGIGGGSYASGNSVQITNGTIHATGGSGGAGIGSGYNGAYSGAVNISDGIVCATGGNGGTGIGSGYNGHCNPISISGGTVIAQGGNRSAGIGGANTPGGTVTVSGGTISAMGGYNGAGIGGGYSGAGGSTYISGGSVFAQGGEGAQDIGHGADSPDSGMLKNAAEGVNIYKATVALQGISNATAITALTTSTGYPYGVNGTKTDAAGKLYLYLPQNAQTTDVQTSFSRYTGLVTTLNTNAASGTLSLARVVAFRSDSNTYVTKTVPDGTSIGSTNWPTNPAKTGYTFARWYTADNGAGTQFTSSTPVTNDIIVYANWVLNTYAIAYHPGGSDVTNPNALTTYTYGSGAVALSVPARTGYTFAGWYNNPGFPGSAVTSVDDALASGYANGSTITLYAKWSINSYGVTFNSQGGNAVLSQNIPYNGRVARPIDPAWTGHTFVDWYKEAACKNLWDFNSDPVTTAMTLYAMWSINSYDVTFNSQGGSAVLSQNIPYNGRVIRPIDPAWNGHTFVDWYKEAACRNRWEFTTDTVGAPVTLFAKWATNSYRVCFYSDNGEYDTVTAKHGDRIDMPAQPKRTGYTFAGWYLEPSCANKWSFFDDTVTADTALFAKWTINSYSITFDSRGGSSTGGNIADYGATIAAPASPVRFAYNFTGWFRNAACTVPWNFAGDTVTGDTTLYAGWVAQPNSAYLCGIALSAL